MKKKAAKKTATELRIVIHQPIVNDKLLTLSNVCMQILNALKLSKDDFAYKQMFDAVAKMTMDRDLIGQRALAFSGSPEEFATMIAQGEMDRISASEQFMTTLKTYLGTCGAKIVFVPDDNLDLEAANALHLIRMGIA